MVAKQKALFTVKFRPCFVCEVFFFVIFSREELQPFFLVHPCLAFIFSITTVFHVGRKAKFWMAFVPSPTFSFIFTKPTATPTYPENFARVVILSGRNFQSVPW